MDDALPSEAAPKGSLLGFFETKVGLLIVGFVLTSILGGALNALIQFTAWKRDVGFTLYQAQVEKAGLLQQEVLNGSGELRVLLNEVRRRTVISESAETIAETRALFDDVLWPLWQSWRANVHQRRNDLALIFGKTAAEAFLDRADNVYFVDRCSVVIVDGDPKTSSDCESRRAEERKRLQGQEPVTEPRSLHHAFRLSVDLVARYLRCRERSAEERAGSTRCGNMRDLRAITNWRFNKTGGARDHLADAIYAEMLRMRERSFSLW